MAFLIIADSPAPAKRFPVESAAVLGRNPDCDVIVDGKAVSRHHAKISRREDGFWLEDLGSRNGTYLNGQLIDQASQLEPSDRIRICDVEFEFQDGENLSPQLPSDSTWRVGGSSFGVLMVDDPAAESSSTLSKVEIRKTNSGVHVAASVETKLNALLQITQTLGNALRLDEVLPKVIEGLFAVFPQADRGFIVLQRDDGELIPRWVKTRRPQDESGTLRISRTIIREAMSEGAAILSMDASSDARFQSSESIADFRIRSMICAPLFSSENQPLGALQIDTTDQRNRFEESDVELLAAVATQAGVAIHNAQLHEQALVQRQVEHDLKLAMDVQAAFLPRREPEFNGYRFRSYYAAARHVGGDYYDYIRLPDGRLGVVVADVVGKGVAAAMFMAKLSAETRFCLASQPDPAKAVERLNSRLADLNVERFVTFLLMVVDPQEDRAFVVNAGHMPPVIRRHDGRIEEPGEAESGLPIGIDGDLEYEAVEVELRVGDVVAMYTDGVNEAMNAAGEQYGMARVREVVGEGGDAAEVSDRVINSVLEHARGCPAHDDICLVVLERVPVERPVGKDTEETKAGGSSLTSEIPG
jgi:serine phosphatase RsbU (regulator of sigma subunit)/pSer/pThr/pTyr-binding forkhead associated (FHA) protein